MGYDNNLLRATLTTHQVQSLAGSDNATLTTLLLYLGVVCTKHPSKAYVDTTWPTENGRN